MPTRKPFNINRCQFCHRSHSELDGEEFWVTLTCDVCSTCAKGRKVLVRLGRYLRIQASGKTTDKKRVAALKKYHANKSK